MSNNNVVEMFNKYECSIEQLIRFYDKNQNKNVKEAGVIYTPWSIVTRMIELAQIRPTDTVVEPACGHGIFLFGLLEYASENWNLSPQGLYNWFTQKVTGVELSSAVVQETRELLKLYFARIGVTNTEFVNIICSDGLLINQKFDTAIGNPPYIRTKNLSNDYRENLRKKFISCQSGNVDIYYAFIEHYLNLTCKTVFITPNSFLTNKSAKALRGLITPRLNYLFDFKEKLIFEDARTYTCIFKLEHNSETFLLNDVLTLKSDYFNESIQKPTMKVLSGIATLADKVFIVDKINDKYYANAVEVEEGILVPLLKITKQKNQCLDSIKYIIYPYNDKSIMSEEYLKTNYPLTYAYLLTQRDKLNKRDKGKVGKYEAWYAYGRKQGLHKYNSDNLTLIPQMIGPDCKPIVLNVAQLLSKYKSLVFTSGFVIDGEVNDYLSKDFLSYAQRCGKPWPGKTQSYYSLTSSQVANYK